MIVRATAAIAALVVALLPTPALAELRWVASGTDPSDVECGPVEGGPCYGFDVRSTSLRIRRSADGRRFLTITLRTDERPYRGWTSGIALDTRGGGGVDRRAFLSNPLGAYMPQPVRCGVRRAKHGSDVREGVYRVRRHGKVATCRFRLWWFAPTKRPIRWHVKTDWIFPEPFPTRDRAPDRGWYP